MSAEVSEQTMRTFKFSYPPCTSDAALFRLEAPVAVPAPRRAARELVQRLIRMFHVPVYLEDELNEKLEQFLVAESKKYHDERDAALLARLRGDGSADASPQGSGAGPPGAAGPAGAEGAVRHWERRFKEHVYEFAEHKGISEEEEFAALYQQLAHSPALAAVLRAEADAARAHRAAAAARDQDIRELTRRQTEEMEEAVRLLGESWTEQQINALAARQFEEQALAAARWGSQLDALAHAQRGQLRQALVAAPPPQLSPILPPPAPPAPAPTPAPARAEESFTIHLGSQLKQTHNLRIVAADVTDLLDFGDADPASAESRMLQTALALYSGELSGVVLLRGSGRGAPAGAADHHFPALDDQLLRAAELAKDPIEKRNLLRHARRASEPGAAARARRGAQTGDVFVTRHSNLPDAHVVFHLVINDEDLKNGEMSSRHPAILGLRSVLQLAACNDVTSLALPLLLRHELTEEMTAAWCVRRAELVLKCVKGFMLEAAGGGGAQLRTLTLCAAPAPPVFAALRALLPAVFRLATPLKIRRPTDQQ